MSPKRRDRAAPPAGPHDWEVRFANNDAAKGWEELCQQAPRNTYAAWQEMRTNAGGAPPTARHHRLKGGYAEDVFDGRRMPQWQIEVTAGGRIWYLLDVERRTVWITYASLRHPKVTE